MRIRMLKITLTQEEEKQLRDLIALLERTKHRMSICLNVPIMCELYGEKITTQERITELITIILDRNEN